MQKYKAGADLRAGELVFLNPKDNKIYPVAKKKEKLKWTIQCPVHGKTPVIEIETGIGCEKCYGK